MNKQSKHDAPELNLCHSKGSEYLYIYIYTHTHLHIIERFLFLIFITFAKNVLKSVQNMRGSEYFPKPKYTLFILMQLT